MKIMNISMATKGRFSLPLCACIGYFDGVHKGHQALIARTVAMAEKHDCESALITFDPDPWVAIYGAANVRHISTMNQRIERALSFGIDNIVILRFTREMSRLSPQDFVEKILGRLNLKGIVCGFDFRYGYKGRGDAESLREQMQAEVAVVDAVRDENGKISSSRISDCLTKGNISEVNRMLGYEYEMEAEVAHGRHKGTGLGFPTANLNYTDEYLLPRSGVYAAYADTLTRTYRAMVNIGHNPTLNYSARLSVEAHLMNCEEDLYGRMIRLRLIRFVRGEQKFAGRQELVSRLEEDQKEINRILDAYEQ